jgi:uncharacterized Ntn-hydrolase superfamily protein
VTYSIVARDPETGALGVAVQTHWFNVGALVPWAEAGVGAVATQANVDVAYGPRGLDLLREGASAREALDRLVAADPHAGVRQVAIVDAVGGVAVHTGDGCMAFAGHETGDDHSAQANMMATSAVWGAMSDAFAASTGPLPHRLLDALDAGEAAGGDVRGRQAAAILVVPGRGESWTRTADLRVEDHPEPLEELRRLVLLQEAYLEAGEGDRLTGEGEHAAAAAAYVRAAGLAPENTELAFWAGLGLLGSGDEEAGLARLRGVIADHAGWGDLLARLTPGDAPAAARAREALGIAAA